MTFIDIYVSNLNENKNLDFLINTFPVLNNISNSFNCKI